ncbi:MAG: hypothetical protein ACR2HM_05765 [Acidimicrobiales bacterium]
MRATAPGTAGLNGLDAFLRPLPIAGEALRFDLSAYRSRVTREMAQVRLRATPQAFMVGDDLLAANLAGEGGDTGDDTVLEVDAAALAACNDEVRRRLDAGADWAVVYLRQLAACRLMVDGMARAVGASLARGSRPPNLVAYVLAVAHHQALGALKFCVPAGLRPRLAALLDASLLDDAGLLDALLAPDGPSLWADLAAEELALARLRSDGSAARYRRRLTRHRRGWGYLYAEDVDFRDHEHLDALDERIATVPTGERSLLAEALAADRARKCEARRRFAEAGGPANLVAQVLLARALAEHEDLNRRAKMRLLRDLRDVAELAGLDIAHAGLEALVTPLRPVVRSS